jgi:hypothetical protein
MCIRCHERQAFGERGYCITCVWAVQVEVEQGMKRLQEYLHNWAAYFDWCAARGLTPV